MHFLAQTTKKHRNGAVLLLFDYELLCSSNWWVIFFLLCLITCWWNDLSSQISKYSISFSLQQQQKHRDGAFVVVRLRTSPFVVPVSHFLSTMPNYLLLKWPLTLDFEIAAAKALLSPFSSINSLIFPTLFLFSSLHHLRRQHFHINHRRLHRCYHHRNTSNTTISAVSILSEK